MWLHSPVETTDNRPVTHIETLIRPARVDDAKAMAEYHHRCSVEAFTSIVEGASFDQLDPRRRVASFRSWIESTESTVHVAELDGSVIAHLVVQGNEIVHLFVDPDHWGLGLGRRLLALGEELLRDAGHQQMELRTMVGNAPAIALYESAGWVVTDELLHQETDGVRYDEHVLLKHTRGQTLRVAPSQ